LFCHTAYSKQIRVAVIDTGISFRVVYKIPLCKEGHRDFTRTTLHDRHGHGTNISGLIDQYARNQILKDPKDIDHINKTNINYCQIILKFYDEKRSSLKSEDRMIEAIEWAIQLKVDIINISAGGVDALSLERFFIKKALDNRIQVVLAAGNDGYELGKNGNYYPAMYDKRAIVVGNWQQKNVRALTSNYGNIVNTWEIGTNSISYSLEDGKLSTMTGTSQATAIHTGKIIRNMINKQ
jgi:major intracellular serine protease